MHKNSLLPDRQFTYDVIVKCPRVTVVAMEKQPYTSHLLFLPTRSCQQYKAHQCCHRKQQWYPFALLSSYKIFPVKDTGLLTSSCKVPDIIARF